MSRGFTILEVLAAVFLLTVGIGGTLTLISQATTLSATSGNRLIASYLAQEGIEVVRNIRDTNILKGVDPGTGIGTGCGDLEGCAYQIDLNTQDQLGTMCESPCDYEDLSVLLVDNGWYQYAGGDASRFRRKITVISQTDGVSVQSTVFWKDREGSASPSLFTASAFLPFSSL